MPLFTPNCRYDGFDMLTLRAVVVDSKKSMRSDADEGRNDPTRRWERAAFLASRLQANGAGQKSSTSQDWLRPQDKKILETQHWLELTDRQVLGGFL